jgi:hypothetical protein
MPLAMKNNTCKLNLDPCKFLSVNYGRNGLIKSTPGGRQDRRGVEQGGGAGASDQDAEEQGPILQNSYFGRNSFG